MALASGLYRLDAGAANPHAYWRQSAGRPLPHQPKGRWRGKSGLHRHTVPDNIRRGRPQGQCHRERTALLRLSRLRRVRVKRCGKSAPRVRQRKRHGKPHREQDRIGTATRAVRASENTAGRCQARRPGRLLEATCKRCPRGMAVTYRLPQAGGALQNPAYRLADILSRSGFRFASRKAHLAKNEGFGANTPDPSPIFLLNQ